MFFNKRLVSLDLTAIVAGTKFRGQFEERIKNVIKELENHPEIIIFIDEIHTMIGAGSGEGSMDAANILKPALARGIIQCIGATTLDEYRKSIEKDGALERRFQKVIVEPTTRNRAQYQATLREASLCEIYRRGSRGMCQTDRALYHRPPLPRQGYRRDR